MKKNLLLGLSLLLASGSVISAEAAFDPGVPAPKPDASYYDGAEKVVFHVSVAKDEKGYMGILGNVNNYIKALEATGKKTDAIIVMNGDGVGLLRTAAEVEMNADAKLPIRINDLKDKGVRFEICYNTLMGRKIPFSSLYGAKPEDVIPSGVAEIGRLQHLGYMMVKP